MNLSNYPPGVTGNEPQITGQDEAPGSAFLDFIVLDCPPDYADYDGSLTERALHQLSAEHGDKIVEAVKALLNDFDNAQCVVCNKAVGWVLLDDDDNRLGQRWYWATLGLNGDGQVLRYCEDHDPVATDDTLDWWETDAGKAALEGAGRDRIPYVGRGVDGCQRSAEIDRSEADGFATGSEDWARCRLSADRWLQQADRWRRQAT